MMTTRLIAPWLVLLLIGLAGCESVSDRIKAKFTPQPARIQAYEASYEEVFAATKITLEDMSFRSVRGRLSSGKLSGVSRLNTNDELSGASQVTVKIEIIEMGEEETEVHVWMTEVVEDRYSQSGGYGTKMPLRGSLLYEILFKGVETVLKSPAKG